MPRRERRREKEAVHDSQENVARCKFCLSPPFWRRRNVDAAPLLVN